MSISGIRHWVKPEYQYVLLRKENIRWWCIVSSCALTFCTFTFIKVCLFIPFARPTAWRKGPELARAWLHGCLTFVACILHVREYQIPPHKFGAEKSANFVSKKSCWNSVRPPQALFGGGGGGGGVGNRGGSVEEGRGQSECCSSQKVIKISRMGLWLISILLCTRHSREKGLVNTLHRHNTEKSKTNITRKGTVWLQPEFLHSCFYERFIYSPDRSAYSAQKNTVGGPNVGIYNSHTETWMWKIGTEAAQFLFWEYINPIFFCSAEYHI
jgi:hypothetical protein